MNTYTCNSVAEFYKMVYEDMINAPEISPKGIKTKEIIAPQILIINPRNRLAIHNDRKFSIKYAITESLMLFSPTNQLKYFSAYNDNIAQFSDDGKTLSGSYGNRIALNIPKMIQLLDLDDSTRQAVLPILGKEDVFIKTKDTPCTLALQFLIRDEKLNLITTMRSNDIIWGLPYDIFMFTTLQEIVANTLGMEIGWYLHRPGSLHLYETHYNLFEKVADKFENKRVIWSEDYETWIGYAQAHLDFVNGEIIYSPVEILSEVLKRGDTHA